MVAAKEGIAAEDDVLRVDPIFGFGIGLVAEDVFQRDVVPMGSKRRRWNGGGVGQQIIAPFGAQGACKAHERHLNRSGAGGKDLVAGSACVAVEVDQYVDFVLDDLLNQPVWRPGAHIAKHWRFALDLLAVDRPVTRGRRVAKGLDARWVVHAENGLHPATVRDNCSSHKEEGCSQVGQRMVVEVGGDISHIQIRARRIGGLVHGGRNPR